MLQFTFSKKRRKKHYNYMCAEYLQKESISDMLSPKEIKTNLEKRNEKETAFTILCIYNPCKTKQKPNFKYILSYPSVKNQIFTRFSFSSEQFQLLPCVSINPIYLSL